VENFRNISSLRMDFSDVANFFLGKNGIGKTNLVEAIYVNFFSRSFRTSNLKNCVKMGERDFSLSCDIVLKGITHNLSMEYKNGVKTLKVDGKRYLLGEYLKYGMIFVITALSSEIVYGEPSLRRKFFDSLITRIYPEYIYLLGRFRKIYANKRDLLVKGVEEKEIFHIWNVELARVYHEIYRKRVEFVKLINEGDVYDLFSRERKKIGILYSPTIDFYRMELKDVVGFLDENLGLEIDRGQVLFGPHRDKFYFTYDEKMAKDFASAGEKRSILLNIFFKMIDILDDLKGELPVFIFDDIETEIDSNRLEKLLLGLKDRVQVFLTSSKPELLEGMLEKKKIFYLRQLFFKQF